MKSDPNPFFERTDPDEMYSNHCLKQSIPRLDLEKSPYI